MSTIQRISTDHHSSNYSSVINITANVQKRDLFEGENQTNFIHLKCGSVMEGHLITKFSDIGYNIWVFFKIVLIDRVINNQ